MTNNVKFVAFSGGCFSGKTTTLNLLKDKLKGNGFEVVVLNENIREFLNASNTIEDVRRDANAYFILQEDVITNKIIRERRFLRNLNLQKTKLIVLADRSLIDSLFYYLFYVDKNNLTRLNAENYETFYEKIDKSIKTAFEHIYDLILMFEPLNKKCYDNTYRPISIDTLKYTESRMIKTLHDSYMAKCNNENLAVMNIDLNKDSQESVVNYIYNILKF